MWMVTRSNAMTATQCILHNMTSGHDQHDEGNFDFLYCAACLKAAQDYWMSLFPAREILNEMAYQIHVHSCDAGTEHRSGKCFCMGDHTETAIE